jgi:hypothetical protein
MFYDTERENAPAGKVPPVAELTPTRIVRRTLEDALETRAASAVLFEALSAAGNQVPQTRAEVLAVVRGPLRHALEKRLDVERADEIVAKIEGELLPVYEEPRTVELPLDELAAETRGDEATASYVTADSAVPVLVVAAGRSFTARLAMALGDGRVAPYTISDARALGIALGGTAPPIFLIDASDYPSIDATDLLSSAARLPMTTACVLWGADLPYGRTLARTIAAQKRQWVVLELREGIAPLLDLIRSRRRSRR